MNKRLLFGLLVFSLVGCGSGKPAPAEAVQKFEAIEVQDFSFQKITLEESGCPKGQEGFKNTLYPLLRAKCASCHEAKATGPVQGPVHSQADVAESYAKIKTYINFDDPVGSRLVKKGGNRHCIEYFDKYVDCGADYDEIRTQVSAWWDAGEKDCSRERKFVTAEIDMPKELPLVKEGYKSIRWSLDDVAPMLKGAVLELQVQRFSVEGGGVPGSYRFRMPRIAATQKPVRIKGMKILINGKYDPTGVRYASINQLVSARSVSSEEMASNIWSFPVLSSAQTILLQGASSGDRVAIAFDELAVDSPRACKALDTFKQKVLPVMEARRCFYCHGGGADKYLGDFPARAGMPKYPVPAKQRFSMDLSEADLCSAALQRVDPSATTESPMISYSLKGANGHPGIIPYPSEVFPNWTEWMNQELAK